jgi:hypothetical protein
MHVLVVYNPDTSEVQVRGPWASAREAGGALIAVQKGATGEEHPERLKLAAVGVTPMVYYDPDIHR